MLVTRCVKVIMPSKPVFRGYIVRVCRPETNTHASKSSKHLLIGHYHLNKQLHWTIKTLYVGVSFIMAVTYLYVEHHNETFIYVSLNIALSTSLTPLCYKPLHCTSVLDETLKETCQNTSNEAASL